MYLHVRKGCSELARYLTSRLLIEDAVWVSLFSEEMSLSIEMITEELVNAYKFDIGPVRIEWLLGSRPERFTKTEDNLWDLTAWHVRKSASLYEKAQAVLRLAALPLPPEEVADLLNKSNLFGTTTPEIAERLLKGRPDLFEKLGPYWVLREWAENPDPEGRSLLEAMIGRNIEVESSSELDVADALRALFSSLHTAVDTGNLKWALKRLDGGVRLASVFGTELLEPVSGGHWIHYELVPGLVKHFLDLHVSQLETYEEHLIQLRQRGCKRYVKRNRDMDRSDASEASTRGRQDEDLVDHEQHVNSVVLEETERLCEHSDNRLRLDHQQSRIVHASSTRRQLVLAPPGSGKTEAVARKLAYLVSDAGDLKPRQILVLSFSRSAVKVLMDRIRDIVEEDSEVYEDLRHVSVRTFDSWAFRMLRLLGCSPRELLRNSYGQDSYARNIRLLVERMLSGETQKKLLNDEDKLKHIRHIIVDECQDLSGPRADLVRQLLILLTAPKGSLEGRVCGFTLLGDMDQAIYEWMMNDHPGSLTSSQLIDFVRSTYKDELEQIRLPVNYRSNDEMVSLIELAAEIIRDEDSDDSPRTARIMQLVAGTGGRLSVPDLGALCEKPAVTLPFAVLFRRNDEAMYTACKLQNEYEFDRSVRLSIEAGDPQDQGLPAWIAFLLGRYRGADITRTHFLKLCDKYQQNAQARQCIPDALSAWRLLVRACYGEAGDMSASVRMEDLREKLTWPDSLPDDEGAEDKRIVITTMHRSKGQQFGEVVLVDSHLEDYPDQDLEEAKVVYVGLSRAIQSVKALDNADAKALYTLTFKDKASNIEYSRLYRCDKDDDWVRLMEIGVRGDLEATSFVSQSFHGSCERVNDLQSFLFEEQENLIGRRVVLCKRLLSTNPYRVVYDIRLPDDGGEALNLGHTTGQLAVALWTKKPTKAKFPDEIHDLHIWRVTTLIAGESDVSDVADPWSVSRMWLGVDIHGIGRFRFPF